MACVTDAEASGLTRAAHDLGMDILVEVHEEAELARALPLETRLVGVNSRDLRTFKVSLDVCERLAAKIPPDRIVVGESGILTHQDCLRLKARGISAVLVGEGLMRQKNVAAAARALLVGEPHPRSYKPLRG
jgi:indole-3-glycerol phosphate synthase